MQSQPASLSPFSKLPPQEVADNLAAGDAHRIPQRGEVERAGEAVRKAKEQHGRNPAADILQGEAAVGHLVLLGLAAPQVMHAALAVDLGLVLARRVGPLLAEEDVEVVVARVAARVALGADG